MPATLSPLVQKSTFKEYLIFRVHEAGDRRELADESALEGEAARYAALRDEAEPQTGIHYEVRRAHGGGLLYTTEDYETHREEPSWRRTATW